MTERRDDRQAKEKVFHLTRDEKVDAWREGNN